MNTEKALTLLRRTVGALESARARVAELEADAAEPIAIIGMACRFPGAPDPTAFEAFFRSGRSAMRDVPPGRWDPARYHDDDPDAPGKAYTQQAGYLGDIRGFDAAFFGIAPREARQLDPQQRLALELAWEGLEHAGIRASDLEGHPTGVFLAAGPSQYLGWGATSEGYALTGNLQAMISGRVSYMLRTRGPSMTVEAACSGSLVAVHLAAQSLRTRESDLALAGGVNLILTPDGHIGLCKVRALAPDAQSKTFDARADGFARAEGGGVVVLKRLGDARRDGDHILALLRGSAVNHDGHSSGLTVPSGPAQTALIRQALANGRVEAHEVGYVETHGTGTRLGDPIEVGALTSAYAARVGGPPVALGAIKPQLGHAEHAAGIAGFIKTVQVLRAGVVPGNAHFVSPNPELGLEQTAFVVPKAPMPWPGGRARRLAAVSSFGMGGTNAHAVLEEAPAATVRPDEPGPGPWLLPLSARSGDALSVLAARMADLLEAPDAPAWHHVCAAAALRRDHHAHRVAVVAADASTAVSHLRELAAGDLPADAATGRRPAGGAPRVVFVFSGQGGQWHGMGRDLYATDPIFRDAIHAIDAAFMAQGAPPPGPIVRGETPPPLSLDPEIIQPALFALQVALATSAMHAGVRPEAVVGHSLGEVVAAHVCGALDLADAIRVVRSRSRLVQAAASGRGAMALIARSADELVAGPLVAAPGVDIAVVDGPDSTVVAGDTDAIDALLAQMASANVWHRRVGVSYASHSHHMDGIIPDLIADLDGITARPASLPFFSTVTAAPMAGEHLDADYWGRNLRQTVRFGEAIRALATEADSFFVEIGPHPVLSRAIAANLTTVERGGHTARTLVRGQPARHSLLTGIARAYASGVDPRWAALYPGPAAHVALPTYPWQRRTYWADSAASTMPGAARTAPLEPTADEPAPLDPTDRATQLDACVLAAVRRTLELDADDALDPEADLFDLGLDSITGLDLTRRLAHRLGRPVSGRLILDHPTVVGIIAALRSSGETGSTPPGPPATRTPRVAAPGAPWCVVRRPRPAARLQLICLPYSAGGAALFRGWDDRLPADVEVCSIRLPGRESRSHEPPFDDLATLLDALVPAVQARLRGPYALFGYSLGGLLAHELAHALIRSGSRAPCGLAVASASSPTQWRRPSADELTDAALLDFLAAGGVVPREALADDALRAAILRRMRADGSLIASHRATAEPPLDCPLLLLAGTRDTVTPWPSMTEWLDRTTGDVSIGRIDAGHFFVHDHLDWLMQRLGAFIDDLAR